MRMPAAPVLLIPGLWAPKATLWPLAHRLARAGFAPMPFAWRSWAEPFAAGVARLRAVAANQDSPVVHMVGHSLGGLLLAALHAEGDLPPGRVVALGTPFAGSSVARWLDRNPAGRLLLGDCGPLLQGGFDAWPGAAELGVIAGDQSWGLGRMMPGLAAPSDGVVTVAETAVAGARDRIQVPATHTTLLLSPTVAREVARFLRDGRFGAGCRRPR